LSIILRAINYSFARPYLKRRLFSCGANFRIGYSSTVLKPNYISIGDNFFSGPRCYMSANNYSKIKVLDDVMFGPEVMVLAGNHDLEYASAHMIFNTHDNPNSQPIVIESGAWIAARCIIVSGAHISEGAALGAGCLCNSYIPPYVLAVGSPAKKFVRRFKDPSDLENILSNTNSSYTLKEIQEIYEKHGIQY